MVFWPMKLECFFPSLSFPHTSQTFNFPSSGTTIITLVAIALSTLPLSPLEDGAATVTTCCSDVTVCTAIELAMLLFGPAGDDEDDDEDEDDKEGAKGTPVAGIG